VRESEANVRAACGGDGAARDRLLEALWPRAFRLAASIVGDRVAAEDAAQDALVLVATRLSSLRDPAAFPLWSTRIVVNAATAVLRRRVVHDRIDALATAPGFEDALADRLDIVDALRTVPLWLRVPLVLRYVDGLSSREIGVTLGAPAATIRFRLALGRRRLAHALGADRPVSEKFA
jgi:RNA polymerase sigma-70 factor (ECF subfamily)